MDALDLEMRRLAASEANGLEKHLADTSKRDALLEALKRTRPQTKVQDLLAGEIPAEDAYEDEQFEDFELLEALTERFGLSDTTALERKAEEAQQHPAQASSPSPPTVLDLVGEAVSASQVANALPKLSGAQLLPSRPRNEIALSDFAPGPSLLRPAATDAPAGTGSGANGSSPQSHPAPAASLGPLDLLATPRPPKRLEPLRQRSGSGSASPSISPAKLPPLTPATSPGVQ